ncbi:MAG: cytochrome b/b6 domain-containing protein, partial [Anaerolineales bacterium]|nr:cytochrome b/b6 domain-containing protein [Anaerolineales bacterium]
MDTPARYNPILVVLHWLTVILLLGAGLLSDSEGGSSPISIHMVLGSLLLLVLVIRLIMRFTTRRPARAQTGNPLLDKLGEIVHVGLYFFAFYILTIGALIASQRNLVGYVLGTGSVSRGNLALLRPLHELGWFAVLGLLFLHVAGALYHQFILKDN